jgi:nucleotide-binding universal stress UspA family protein
MAGIHVINSKVLLSHYYVDASLALGYTGNMRDMVPVEDALKKTGSQILEKFLKKCEGEGIDPKVLMIKGVVDDTIVQEGKNHDLIVISRTGEHAHFIKGLMGSTTEPVLHRSETTVLVTPEIFEEIKQPFVAFDGSRAAVKALGFACRFCKRLDLPLAILIVEDKVDKGKELVQQAQSVCTESRIEPEVVAIPGYPEDEILKFTRIGKMDLAFLGSHGHSRLREFIIGSTTLFVTRNTEIAVFVIR